MTIYHYCSNHVFHSIITGGALRVSSMSLSNDSEEGKWIMRLVRQGLTPRINGAFEIGKFTHFNLNQCMNALQGLGESFDGLGLCFSKDGDMLSQWRGYADDARGMSIGFSEPVLSKWAKARATSLIEIIYDSNAALAELTELIDLLVEYALKGAFDSPFGGILSTDAEIEERKARTKTAYNAFFSRALKKITDNLYRFKNPAFKEELEWRLMTPFMADFPGADFLMNPTPAGLKPFRSFTLDDSAKSMVTDLVLGPKNITPQIAVEAFLRSNGFLNVDVRRSEATYR